MKRPREDQVSVDDDPDIIWDEDYKDPKAEIVLKSQDGVHFRVHQWSLVRHSEFIADMLSAFGNPLDAEPETKRPKGNIVGSKTPVIDMEATSTIVRVYIGLLNSHDAQSFPKEDITVRQLLQLSELCKHMQSPQWDATIDKLIRQRYRSEAWAFLKYAAVKEDIKLARKSIEYLPFTHLRMRAKSTPPPLRYPSCRLQEFDPLPMEWIFELVRLMYKHSQVENEEDRFEKIGKGFFNDEEFEEDIRCPPSPNGCSQQ